MGGSHSLPSIDNGYELVIRVSKELENALRIKLKLTNTASNDDGNEDKDQGLTKMIGGARDLVCSETFAAMMRVAKSKFIFVVFSEVYEMKILMTLLSSQ